MCRDVVVIGGSAGSAQPLATLLEKVPSGLPVTVFVVIHAGMTIWNTSSLVEILQHETKLTVVAASDQQRIESGVVYVCPDDHHLSIEGGRLHLDQAPKEHRARPSIDVLFRSAASEYGRRVVGVLLSGLLQDGTAGLWQIKQRGGFVMVQDPIEAEFGGMPSSAIGNVAVDRVAPVRDLAEELVLLLTASANREEESSKTILIVEDEGLVARNLKERLTEAGYKVCGLATSGPDAIRLAAEQVPDLILMDIRLQGEMTGVEAARAIWEALQIPIVFVTANADAATLSEVKTVPNYGYVLKPFQSTGIQAVVELALDRRARELQHAFGPNPASS